MPWCNTTTAPNHSNSLHCTVLYFTLNIAMCKYFYDICLNLSAVQWISLVQAVVAWSPRHALLKTVEKSGLANQDWPSKVFFKVTHKSQNCRPWEIYPDVLRLVCSNNRGWSQKSKVKRISLNRGGEIMLRIILSMFSCKVFFCPKVMFWVP